MKLELQPKEAVILKEILTHFLSDLRFDIADTEAYELRQAMKGEEDTIRSIITRLDEVAATQR